MSRFSTRSCALALALSIVGTLVVAGSSEAQFGGGGMGEGITERYNKAKKGGNIGDYARRLTDDEPEIRLEAVKSLGDSGDPKAIEHLIQAITDPDVRVQAKAVEYLGKIRATDATFALVQRLFLADTPDPLRHRILNALGQIGDPSSAKPLAEFLSRDTDPDLRGTGIYALGEIGSPNARPDLVAMLETEENAGLRRLIQEAITKIDTRQAAPPKKEGPFLSPLEAALQTDDQQQQQQRQ